MLTPKHQAFVQYRAAGKSQDEAYTLAGYKPNRQAASRLAAKPEIREALAELQAENAKRSIWDREMGLRILAEIATDKTNPAAPRVSAVTAAMKMIGEDGVTKIEQRLSIEEELAAISDAEILEAMNARTH